MRARQARSSTRTLWLVAACVFHSGLASLALEVVWSRLLKLVFGSTTLAITTILVAYMLGLGLGGLFGGRLAKRLRNGVAAYGWMEVAVGLYALTVPWLLSFYPELNRGLLAPLGFWPAAFVRFAAVLVLLLLPTLLMGATLPVLVQALVRGRSEIAGRVGLLYGMNTLGAVVGVLLTTFVAFQALGVRTTNHVAAGLDLVVGLLAVFVLAPRLASAGASEGSADEPEDARAPDAFGAAAGLRGWVLASYATVGFTALAYEVAWTRALSMILGGSVYTFATMLAGFLAGIALGSLVARRWLDRLRAPMRAYGLGLLLLGLSSWFVVYVFAALPDLFLTAFASVGISGANLVWLGLAISFLVMLAPTFLLGALFPLTVRLVGAGGDQARAVGDVYFANTVGSGSGAFCAGFLFIPLLGLQATIAIAIAINLAMAALVSFKAMGAKDGEGRPLGATPVALVALLGLIVVGALPPHWRRDDFATGVYYRSSVQLDFGLPEVVVPAIGEDELLFYEEGINCTVSVHRSAGGIEEGMVSLRINGKTDASFTDMSTQVLSGHLPILFGGAEAKDALVIGYASGITAGALSLWDLERVDVCEIEPAVIAAAEFFAEYNHSPLEKQNVHTIVDDGRTVLSTARDRWDVIVSEPSNPWMTGCANLFTSEFFAEAQQALRPGGRLLQWIQLYGMDPEGLASVLAALHEHFACAYGILYDSTSTDLLLIATDEPLEPADLPQWAALPEPVQRDLERIRLFDTADLLSLLVLDAGDLAALAGEAPTTNTDDSMYVELRAPWYLYEDTPETTELIRERESGILSVIEGHEDGWDPFPQSLRGELAMAYLSRRLNQKLGDAIYDTLTEPWDMGYRATYDGELKILVGKASEPLTLNLFDEAVDLAPDAYLPRFHRGWLLGHLGRFEEAESDLALALRVKPNQLEVRYERMKVLGDLRRLQEARQEAEALLVSPLLETQPRLWMHAAWLAGGFGDLELAIERARRYLELMPYSPDDWRLLAAFHDENGDEPARDRALETAEQVSAEQVRELHWLGRWNEHYGGLEDALKAFEGVLEMEPENAAAREDLERVRGKLGARGA